jgi:hypothetical protein
MNGAASDSSMRTTIVDPTSKPTAQELLPRLIGFPLETRALLHDMWQLFLAVQLIPVSAAAFACEIKSTLSSLGKLGQTGWWTVDRGPWTVDARMMMTHDFGDACSPIAANTVRRWAVSGQWAELWSV